MLVKNKKNLNCADILMKNSAIEIVHEYKYLGIVLDDKLSLKPLVDSICKKMNKKIYIYKRCEKKLNIAIKITFYNSLVLPHVLNKSQQQKIQLIQNRFMRTI